MTELLRGENGESRPQVPQQGVRQTFLIVDEGGVKTGISSEQSLPPSLKMFDQRQVEDGTLVIDMRHLAPTIAEVANSR